MSETGNPKDITDPVQGVENLAPPTGYATVTERRFDGSFISGAGNDIFYFNDSFVYGVGDVRGDDFYVIGQYQIGNINLLDVTGDNRVYFDDNFVINYARASGQGLILGYDNGDGGYSELRVRDANTRYKFYLGNNDTALTVEQLITDVGVTHAPVGTPTKTLTAGGVFEVDDTLITASTDFGVTLLGGIGLDVFTLGFSQNGTLNGRAGADYYYLTRFQESTSLNLRDTEGENHFIVEAGVAIADVDDSGEAIILDLANGGEIRIAGGLTKYSFHIGDFGQGTVTGTEFLNAYKDGVGLTLNLSNLTFPEESGAVEGTDADDDILDASALTANSWVNFNASDWSPDGTNIASGTAVSGDVTATFTLSGDKAIEGYTGGSMVDKIRIGSTALTIDGGGGDESEDDEVHVDGGTYTINMTDSSSFTLETALVSHTIRNVETLNVLGTSSADILQTASAGSYNLKDGEINGLTVSGFDTLTLADGKNSITLDDGSIGTINVGSGTNNALVVDDTANATINLADNTYEIGTASGNFVGGFASVTTGGGADTITVDSLGDLTSVNGGTDNDTLNINVFGTYTITAGTGNSITLTQNSIDYTITDVEDIVVSANDDSFELASAINGLGIDAKGGADILEFTDASLAIDLSVIDTLTIGSNNMKVMGFETLDLVDGANTITLSANSNQFDTIELGTGNHELVVTGDGVINFTFGAEEFIHAGVRLVGSIVKITGGDGADTFTGDENNNTITLGSSNDTAKDTVVASGGSDVIIGFGQNDVLNFGSAGLGITSIGDLTFTANGDNLQISFTEGEGIHTTTLQDVGYIITDTTDNYFGDYARYFVASNVGAKQLAIAAVHKVTASSAGLGVGSDRNYDVVDASESAATAAFVNFHTLSYTFGSTAVARRNAELTIGGTDITITFNNVDSYIGSDIVDLIRLTEEERALVIDGKGGADELHIDSGNHTLTIFDSTASYTISNGETAHTIRNIAMIEAVSTTGTTDNLIFADDGNFDLTTVDMVKGFTITGFETITLSADNDVATVVANNTITYAIAGGGGDDTLMLGNNDAAEFNAMSGVLKQGTDDLTTQGFKNFTGGNGNDTVILAGVTGFKFDGGGGTDTIDVGDGDWMITGSADDFTVTSNTLVNTAENVEKISSGDDDNSWTLASAIAGLEIDAGGETSGDVLQFTAIDGTYDLTALGKVGGMSGMTVVDFETLELADGVNTLRINENSGQFDIIKLGTGANVLQVIGSSDAIINLETKIFSIGSMATLEGNIATVIGGDGKDTLLGSGEGDNLSGGAGNDTLSGAAGADTLNGGANDDRIIGGDGNDTLNGDGGADTLDGGDGDDMLDGGAGADTFIASEGSDTILGFSKADGDKIDFTEWGLTNLSEATFTEVTGGGKYIYEGNTLTIMGTLGDITDASNFILPAAGRGASYLATATDKFGYFASVGDSGDILSFANFTAGVTFNLSTGVLNSSTTLTVAGIDGVQGTAANDEFTFDSAKTNFYVASGGDDTLTGFTADDILDFTEFSGLSAGRLTFTAGSDTTITSDVEGFGTLTLSGVSLTASDVTILADDYSAPRRLSVTTDTVFTGVDGQSNNYISVDNTTGIWLVNLGADTMIAGVGDSSFTIAEGVRSSTVSGLASIADGNLAGSVKDASNIQWLDGGNKLAVLIGDGQSNRFFNIGTGSVVQGGKGNDIYYIDAYKDAKFTITDFESGDTINFQNRQFVAGDDITYERSGQDALIVYDNITITIRGGGGTGNVDDAAVEAAFENSLTNLAADRVLGEKNKAPFTSTDANRLDFDISDNAYTVVDYSTQSSPTNLRVNLSGIKYDPGPSGNLSSGGGYYISFFSGTNNGSFYNGTSPTVSTHDNTPGRAAAIDAVIGGGSADVLIGNDNDNYFDPGAGVDNGGYSAAMFRGGKGADTLVINKNLGGASTYQFRDFNTEDGDKIDFRKIGIANVAAAGITKTADHTNGLQFIIGATSGNPSATANITDANDIRLVFGTDTGGPVTGNVNTAKFEDYGDDEAARITAFFEEVGLFNDGSLPFIDPTRPVEVDDDDIDPTLTVGNRSNYFEGDPLSETTLDFTRITSGVRVNLHESNSYGTNGIATTDTATIAIYQEQAYAVSDATVPLTAAKIASAWSFSDINHIIGTAQNDLIIGNSGDNTLQGGAGADVIVGGGGDDTLIDGGGADTYDGGTGTDTVSFTAGITTAEDTFNSIEVFALSDENDTLDLSTSIIGVTVTAGDGINTITGGRRNDTLTGGSDMNHFIGGAGDDTFIINGSVTGTYDGGADNDTIRGEGAMNLSDFTSIENVVQIGGFGDIQGTNNNDKITLFGANDVYIGGGDDTITGGTGNNTVFFDSISGLSVNVSNFIAEARFDTTFLIIDDGRASGFGENNKLKDVNTISGTANNDTITVNGVTNVEYNLGDGTGDKIIVGTAIQGLKFTTTGNGFRIIDGNKVSRFSFTEEIDFIHRTNALTLTVEGVSGKVLNVDGTRDNLLVLNNFTSFDLLGSAGSKFAGFNNINGSDSRGEIIRGNDNDNIINGGGSDDTIRITKGNDTIDGGAGNSDTLDYADTFLGGTKANAKLTSDGSGNFTLVDSHFGTDEFKNIERIALTNLADTFTLSIHANDTIELNSGGGADDITIEGTGNETIIVNGTSGGVFDLGAGDEDALSLISNLAAANTITVTDDGYTIAFGGNTLTAENTERLILSFLNDTITISSQTGQNLYIDASAGGSDTITGGAGDETIIYGTAIAEINGGAGTDIITTADTGTVNIDLTNNTGRSTISNIDLVQQLTAGSVRTSNSDDNIKAVGDFANTLRSGSGDDTIDGGEGADSFHYDDLNSAGGPQPLLAGLQSRLALTATITSGTTMFQGTMTDDVITITDSRSSGYGVNKFVGVENFHIGVFGKTVDDHLTIEEVAQGEFSLYGGTDIITVARDKIDFNASSFAASGGKLISADGNRTMTLNGVESYDISFSDAAERITLKDNFTDVEAQGGDDRIFGSAVANVIDGGAGKDTITGGGGNDTLKGGADDDTIDGEVGDDILTGGGGSDTFTISSGTDTITDLTAGDIVDWSSATFDDMEATEERFITLATDFAFTKDGNDLVMGGGAYKVNNVAGELRLAGYAASVGITDSDTAETAGQKAVTYFTGGGAGDALFLFDGEGQATHELKFNDDIINGDTGNNMLTGGAGADTFIVSSGTDTITDLKLSHDDAVDWSGATFDDMAATEARFITLATNFAFTKDGNDLVMGGGAYKVNGVAGELRLADYAGSVGITDADTAMTAGEKAVAYFTGSGVGSGLFLFDGEAGAGVVDNSIAGMLGVNDILVRDLLARGRVYVNFSDNDWTPVAGTTVVSDSARNADKSISFTNINGYIGSTGSNSEYILIGGTTALTLDGGGEDGGPQDNIYVNGGTWTVIGEDKHDFMLTDGTTTTHTIQNFEQITGDNTAAETFKFAAPIDGLFVFAGNGTGDILEFTENDTFDLSSNQQRVNNMSVAGFKTLQLAGGINEVSVNSRTVFETVNFGTGNNIVTINGGSYDFDTQLYTLGSKTITFTGNVAHVKGDSIVGETFIGNSADNTFTVGSGRDTIVVSNGDDVIHGFQAYEGNEFLDFSKTGLSPHGIDFRFAGDDLVLSYVIGADDATIRLVAPSGSATELLKATVGDNPTQQDLIDTLVKANVVAFSADTTETLNITGGVGDEHFQGGIKDDKFTGNGGNDIYSVSGGKDTITDFNDGDIVNMDFLINNDSRTAEFRTNAVEVGGAELTVLNFGDLTFSTFTATTTMNDIKISGFSVINQPAVGGTTTTIGELIIEDQAALITTINALAGASFDAKAATYFGNDGAGDKFFILKGEIDGTDENDIITGTDENDFITTFAGHDTIHGGAGSDTINGGAGDDIINGGIGKDNLTGGAGADTFVISAGTDTITDLTSPDIVDWGGIADYYLENFSFTTSGSNSADLTISGFKIGGTESALTLTGYGEHANAAYFTGSGMGAGLFELTEAIRGGDTGTTISGTTGDDTIVGEGGADTFTISSGTDTIADFSSPANEIVDWRGATVRIGEQDVALTEANLDALTFTTTANAVGINGFLKITGFKFGGIDGELFIGHGEGGIEFGHGLNSIFAANTATYTASDFDGNAALYFGLNGTGDINFLFSGEIDGTKSSDTINGTVIADIITAFAGNDTVHGGAGNDTIYGDNGNDTLNGDAGDDTIHGGGFSDTINGGADNDTLYGDSGNDTLNGDAGNDTIYGNIGSDKINGGAGDDTIIGGTGVDEINGGAGDDTISLNDGTNTDSASDTLTLSSGNDIVTDLGAEDVVDWTNIRLAGVALTEAKFDMLTFEQVGTSDDLRISGFIINSVASSLQLDDYYDDVDDFTDSGTLKEKAVAYFARNGVGERLFRFTGEILGTSSAETLNGDSVSNVIRGYGGVDIINGMGGNDAIYGNDGGDTLNGNAGNDTIYGGASFDTINGGADDDTLTGGSGNDSFVISSGTDTITDLTLGDRVDWGTITEHEFAGQFRFAKVGTNGVNLRIFGFQIGGIDSELILIGQGAKDDASYWVGGTVANLFKLTASPPIIGGLEANNLVGFASNDTIDGRGGNDTIDGRGGDDKLTGGAGADTFVVSSGSDTITDFTTDDKVNWGTVTDRDFAASAFAREGDNLRIHGFSVGGVDSELTINGQAANDYPGYWLNGAGAGLFELIDAPPILGTREAETINGFASDDTIRGGEGDDIINGGDGNDTLLGGANNDTLNGGNHNDRLEGGGGNDTLIGGAGNDTLGGGFGDDILTGGLGNDTFVVSLGTDTITTNDFTNNDVVDWSQVSSVTEATLEATNGFTFIENKDNGVIVGFHIRFVINNITDILHINTASLGQSVENSAGSGNFNAKAKKYFGAGGAGDHLFRFSGESAPPQENHLSLSTAYEINFNGNGRDIDFENNDTLNFTNGDDNLNRDELWQAIQQGNLEILFDDGDINVSYGTADITISNSDYADQFGSDNEVNSQSELDAFITLLNVDIA